MYFDLLAKYASQFGAGSQYAYYHEGDDSSFQLVDTSKPHKTAYQRNKQRFNNVSFHVLYFPQLLVRNLKYTLLHMLIENSTCPLSFIW